MNKKQKKMLIRIVIAAVLVVAFSLIPMKGYVKFVLFMIPYLVIGYDILKKAGKGILNRQMFDENFLMAVATIGAILLGDYKEGVAVMLFYQIGELFQSYAVGKSRRNISELMDIRPDYANIEQDEKLEQVDPDEVEIGSVIVVQPGEKVPIDGIVAEGASTLNTSALTGESVPQDVHCGDEIISGCINMTGVLKIRTTKEFGESTLLKESLTILHNTLAAVQLPQGSSLDLTDMESAEKQLEEDGTKLNEALTGMSTGLARMQQLAQEVGAYKTTVETQLETAKTALDAIDWAALDQEVRADSQAKADAAVEAAMQKALENYGLSADQIQAAQGEVKTAVNSALDQVFVSEEAKTQISIGTGKKQKNQDQR